MITALLLAIALLPWHALVVDALALLRALLALIAVLVLMAFIATRNPNALLKKLLVPLALERK